MEQKHLARLNELAKLAKERALTAEETAERAELRKEYLATFRATFQQQLDNTVIQYDDGTRVPMSAFKKLHQAVMPRLRSADECSRGFSCEPWILKRALQPMQTAEGRESFGASAERFLYLLCLFGLHRDADLGHKLFRIVGNAVVNERNLA